MHLKIFKKVLAMQTQIILLPTKAKKFFSLFTLFLIILLDATNIALIVPLLAPLLSDHVHGILVQALSVTHKSLLYGAILTVSNIALFLGAPWLGDLSDHLGRKKVLLICLVFAGIGFCFSAVSVIYKSVMLLIIGRVMSGFFTSSQALAQASVVDMSNEKNKSLYLTFITLAVCSGFIVGPFFSDLLTNSFLMSKFGFALPFWFATLLSFLSAILLLLLYKETYQPKETQKLHLTKSIKVFTDAFLHPEIRMLSLTFLLAEIAWGLFFQFFPVYLLDKFHFTEIKISELITSMGILFAVALLLMMPIVLRYLKIGKIVFYSLLLTVMGSFLVLIPDPDYLYFYIIPLSLGGAIFYVAFMNLFSNAVRKDKQGWIMGIFVAIIGAAWVLSSILGSILNLFNVYVPIIFSASLFVISNVMCMKYYHQK